MDNLQTKAKKDCKKMRSLKQKYKGSSANENGIVYSNDEEFQKEEKATHMVQNAVMTIKEKLRQLELGSGSGRMACRK